MELHHRVEAFEERLQKGVSAVPTCCGVSSGSAPGTWGAGLSSECGGMHGPDFAALALLDENSPEDADLYGYSWCACMRSFETPPEVAIVA